MFQSPCQQCFTIAVVIVSRAESTLRTNYSWREGVPCRVFQDYAERKKLHHYVIVGALVVSGKPFTSYEHPHAGMSPGVETRAASAQGAILLERFSVTFGSFLSQPFFGSSVGS